MTTYIGDPVVWNRTIWRGSDMDWTTRRVDETGVPLVPTSARAQVRDTFGGAIWLDITGVIDPLTGWITLPIPSSLTQGAGWDTRKRGVWDLEVVYGGETYRWAMGQILVSQDVTR
jgi:hypothetical protein